MSIHMINICRTFEELHKCLSTGQNGNVCFVSEEINMTEFWKSEEIRNEELLKLYPD